MFKGQRFAVIEFGIKSLEAYDTVFGGGHAAAGARRHGGEEVGGERRREKISTRKERHEGTKAEEDVSLCLLPEAARIRRGGEPREDGTEED